MSETVFAGNINGAAVEAQYSDMTKPKQNSNSNFDLNNYLNLRLDKNEESKIVAVRILPASATDGNFVTPIVRHSLKVDKKISESGFKKYICLTTKDIPNNVEGEKCPLCEKKWFWWNKAKEELAKADEETKNGNNVLAEELKKKAQSYKDKSKMYSPIEAYVVRVIDRKHEDEGVKFWCFNRNYKGKGMYDELMTIYNTRKMEYEMQGIKDYNIFNLDDGCDMFITVKRQYDKEGKEIPYPSITISPASKPTPLSTDVEKANGWINDPKKWYDVYSVRTADYLSIIADEKIPVKDGNGGYVGKTPLDFVVPTATDGNVAERQAELQVKNDMLKSSEVPQEIVDSVVGDLPF